MSNLDLLDVSLKQYDVLYAANEELFESVNNWFYFKNDKEASSRASQGLVRCGGSNGYSYERGIPWDDYGAAVLLCKSDKVNLDNLRTKCANAKDGVVRFELTDGTKAHYKIMKDPEGLFGPKGGEHVVIIIPNNPQTKKWPYSLKGKAAEFKDVRDEEGTLPHAVATGAIESLIPANIKAEIGLGQSQEKSDCSVDELFNNLYEGKISGEELRENLIKLTNATKTEAEVDALEQKIEAGAEMLNKLLAKDKILENKKSGLNKKIGGLTLGGKKQ